MRTPPATSGTGINMLHKGLISPTAWITTTAKRRVATAQIQLEVHPAETKKAARNLSRTASTKSAGSLGAARRIVMFADDVTETGEIVIDM